MLWRRCTGLPERVEGLRSVVTSSSRPISTNILKPSMFATHIRGLVFARTRLVTKAVFILSKYG